MKVQETMDKLENAIKELTVQFATSFYMQQLRNKVAEPDIGNCVKYGCLRTARALRELAESVEKYDGG